MSSVLTLLLGFAAGVAVVGLVGYVRQARSADATTVVDAIESGDLSRTVPERGPRIQRLLARTVNSMAADFQEILLLFAHYIRALQKRAATLTPEGEGGSAAASRSHAELLADLREMERVLHDFKYFRVRIEDGAIKDVGVTEPSSGTRAEP